VKRISEENGWEDGRRIYRRMDEFSRKKGRGEKEPLNVSGMKRKSSVFVIMRV
jgi:hypothetical protein